VNEILDLLDYRRTVSEMYATMRRSRLDEAGRCLEFRRARDELFRAHPQSAIPPEHRARFQGLRYYPYDPTLRFVLPLDTAVKSEVIEMHLRADGIVQLMRLGRVHFVVQTEEVSLMLFWMLGYGGGVFLPFRDASAVDETYEGGRYLLDTIKGADLGQDGASLVIDFNYAYNPSCAYNPHWDCPLAPPENWLPVAIRAGELRYG